jgi:hypothetical protein
MISVIESINGNRRVLVEKDHAANPPTGNLINLDWPIKPWERTKVRGASASDLTGTAFMRALLAGRE